MTPEDCQRLEACLLEAAEILYRNTVKEELTTFESLEKAVRTKMLEEVSLFCHFPEEASSSGAKSS
jgi:hypothetical protein